MQQPSRFFTRRRLFLTAALLIALLAVWFFFFRAPASKAPTVGPSAWAGPVPVRVVPAVVEPLTMRVRAIGTVTPLNTVTVRSRVEGELTKLLFQEGQQVEAGQLLAQIDPRPYQVQLDQALGQQQQNQALLRNAELDLKRYQTLFKQDSIARQQLDSQQSLVRQYQGAQKTDQAQVDNAKLQLSFTRITAPIAGRIGLRVVDQGNLVSTGDTAGLAVITQTRPISVIFSVPEVQLAELMPQVRAGRKLVVEAWNSDDRTQLASGTLTTVDNRIDTTTGSLRLRAEFANQDDALFPNQFVNVRLQVRTLDDALTVPADAVQYGNRGPYVYAISADNKAAVRLLKLGPSDSGRMAVLEGLQAGENVVLEGIDRLSEGRVVRIVAETPAAGPATGAPGEGDAATPAQQQQQRRPRRG
ncbi:Probable Co/Zn/Cd efflux system membrane fusion protein [plant metagenome]